MIETRVVRLPDRLPQKFRFHLSILIYFEKGYLIASVNAPVFARKTESSISV